MRFVVEGRLRAASRLTPAEAVALAIREWAMVIDWRRAGTALGYGRFSGESGGAIEVDVPSEAAAWRLAAALPFAPHAELRVRRVTASPGRAGAGGPPERQSGLVAPAPPAGPGDRHVQPAEVGRREETLDR